MPRSGTCKAKLSLTAVLAQEGCNPFVFTNSWYLTYALQLVWHNHSFVWSTQVIDDHQPEPIPIEQLAHFTHAIRFESHDPAKNRHSFYVLSWEQTLDGSTVLVSTWGRMHTYGRSRVMCTATQPNAQDIVARIIRRRLQRGYYVARWQ